LHEDEGDDVYGLHTVLDDVIKVKGAATKDSV
jgi:hypothetical protein